MPRHEACNLSPHDVVEIGGDLRREVDEQVHVTVRSVLRANDRPEDGDVNDPRPTELYFMGAKPRGNVREEGHMDQPAAFAVRRQRRLLERPVA